MSYSGHVPMENRNGLVANVELLQANGTAERDAALLMIEAIPGDRRMTVGRTRTMAPRTSSDARSLKATPHISQNNKRRKSAIDARTARHAAIALVRRSANGSSAG